MIKVQEEEGKTNVRRAKPGPGQVNFLPMVDSQLASKHLIYICAFFQHVESAHCSVNNTWNKCPPFNAKHWPG